MAHHVARSLVVLISFLFAGCTQHDSPADPDVSIPDSRSSDAGGEIHCGDTSCNANETCSTCPGDCGACPTLPARLNAKLQAKLDELQLALTQGLSAAVIVRNKGTWLGATGYSHPGTKINPTTRFPIYSITKTYTATVTMKLAEMSKVALADTVGTWVTPPIQNLSRSITVADLLGHKSGFGEGNLNPALQVALDADPSRIWTAAEVLAYLDPPEYPQGEFHYSTINALVTGIIVEKATGSPYHQILTSLILGPLGLDETFFEPQLPESPPQVHIWKQGFDVTPPDYNKFSTNWWAGGAIHATADNVARFFQALFGGLLSQASLTKMMNGKLGIFQLNLAGRTEWGHGGVGLGARACALYEPLSSTSVVVLKNEAGSNWDSCEALLQVVLNDPP